MRVELGNRAASFLERVRQKGDLLGLDSVQNLFGELDNPQEELSAIQVVGTNGKGSVCCYLSHILQEAGYRVGIFTSPQVFSYEERFVVNDVPITADEMEAALAEIETAYHRLEIKNRALPTIFEVEVAVAVLFFSRRDCDLVIMEAGMGGDLDATNVFSHPLLAVFTAIGLDHTQFLGETVEEIAAHKAGILKAGEQAVSCWQDGAVERVLRGCVRGVERDGFFGEDGDIEQSGDGEQFENKEQFGDVDVGQNVERINGVQNGVHSLQSFDEQLVIADRRKLRIESYEPLTFSYGSWQHITLGMQGDYQIENAVVALLAVEALRELGYAISDEAVRNGFFAARWRGRMERLDAKPAVYLDGAHNPSAARALAETVERQFAGKSITFVMGMLADKAYREVLALLVPLASHLIAVTPPSERALEAKELAAVAEGLTDAEIAVAEDMRDAVRLTKAFADDVVVVTGTLTILAECKKAFCDY